MKYMKAVAVMVMVLCLVNENGMSQRRVSTEDRANIEKSINDIGSGLYQLMDIVNVDSAIGNATVAGGNIEDPYHTLARSILYSAEGNEIGPNYTPRGFIGVYRDGLVVWRSDTLINDALTWFPKFLASGDLNNDGMVDVVTSWFKGVKQNVEYLWIFEWDGQQGRCINAINERNESEIVALAHTFEFVDVDGDGIMEIRGRWPNEDSITTYTWNGALYGNWSGRAEPPTSRYLPRNNLQADLSADVEEVGGLLRYRYRLSNRPSSAQKIDEVMVKYDSGVVITSDGGRKDWRFSTKKHYLATWNNWFGVPNNIGAGESDSSFAFRGTGLPGIRYAYVRGANTNSTEPPFDDAAWYADVLTNSFVVLTVAPVLPPPASDQVAFIDSLIAIVEKSSSIGWIHDAATSSKYQMLLDSARTRLAAHRVEAARSSLLQILQNVSADSGTSLSAESFALLKFNTRGLLNQFSPHPEFCTLTVTISGEGSVLKEPDLPQYPYGTNVRLTAQPGARSIFSAWSGDTTSADNPLSLSMDDNRSLTAEFLGVPPAVVALSPGMALAGMGSAALKVTGAGFAGGAVVRWNGSPRTTRFISSALLEADIQASDLANAGTYDVTVANPGSAPSRSVPFSVVRALPNPLSPVLECITPNTDGSYTAWFGYLNENEVSVYLPVGSENAFKPSPQDRSQVTIFLPGRQSKVFGVKFDENGLTWSLHGKTCKVTTSAPRCHN